VWRADAGGGAGWGGGGGVAVDNPTLEALVRVTRVGQQIRDTPIPGEQKEALRRTVIGVVAFLVASVAGIYVTDGLDKVSVKLVEEKEKRRIEKEEARMLQERVAELRRVVPAEQFEKLLKAAGSEKEFVRRLRRNWNGTYFLEGN
jgi:hypothetical protein